ncbi:MAG TPA: thioesterase family protein [Thermoanaerobaculia bacterium]|nr:thioesterase family protein [Thermoanaerobaculia bacterium]
MHEYRTRRRVEFVDTDLSGIAHFSRYLVFMENCEHEFLNALGLSVFMEMDGQRIVWPRVAASCEYLSPARFEDVLEVHLKVLRKGGKSLTYGFEITREGTLVARGRTTAVCCVLDGSEVRSIPIPETIAGRIEEAPE